MERRTPRPSKIPEERRTGKKVRLSPIQSLASSEVALQNTAKIPHRIKTGKVKINFFLEKERSRARLKACSSSFQVIGSLC